ncbi:MAG: hypothetical protein ABSD70_09130 [Terracidiphilus sp.]|jgi:hypothetical protein
MPYHNPIPEKKQRSGSSSGGSGLFGAYVQAEKLMQIAFVLPAAAGIGLAAGWWIGNLLHQRWIEALGIIVGCVSGLVYVLQIAIAAEKATPTEGSSPHGAGEETRDREL